MALKLRFAVDNFSKLNKEAPDCKGFVKNREKDRTSNMLKTLKDDEARLSQVIDELQSLHRDMFYIPERAPSPDAEASDVLQISQPENVVMESNIVDNIPELWPDSFRTSPEIPMDVSDSSVFSGAANKDYVTEDYCVTLSSDDDDLTPLDTNQDCWNYSKEEEEELVKKAFLDLVANEECEVHKLVLRLLEEYETFKFDHSAVEKVPDTSKVFPSQSHDHYQKKLYKLCSRVASIDKLLFKIHGKYANILKNILKT